MSVSSEVGAAYLHIDFPDAQEISFNRARVRRAFTTIGRDLMKDARRLVVRRAVSRAGENPGFRSGRLAKSIGYVVPRASSRRPGFMVKVAHNMPEGSSRHIAGKDFYPAFLYYGVRRGAKRNKSHKAGASGGKPWRIEPRANYLATVVKRRRYMIQRFLFTELKASVRKKKK